MPRRRRRRPSAARRRRTAARARVRADRPTTTAPIVGPAGARSRSVGPPPAADPRPRREGSVGAGRTDFAAGAAPLRAAGAAAGSRCPHTRRRLHRRRRHPANSTARRRCSPTSSYFDHLHILYYCVRLHLRRRLITGSGPSRGPRQVATGSDCLDRNRK